MPELSSLMMNPQNVMSTLLEQLGSDNPAMAMMIQMMLNQQEAQEDQEQASEDAIKEIEVRLAETERELEIVRAEGKRLLSAHRAALERLGDLAAALGACGLCWGEDPDCPGCRGRGHIGMFRPDPEIRARLLGPARPAIQPAGQSQCE